MVGKRYLAVFPAKMHCFMTPINFPARFLPLLLTILHKKVHVNELTGLRSNWLIGYYALGRGKFSAKTISINNFSSERVDSKGLYGR